MSKAMQINKCLWVLNQLIDHPNGLNYKELMQKWSRSSMNDTGTDISKRTLYNFRNVIFDMFGLVVDCARHRNYTYYIKNWEDIEDDDLKNWLLSTFAVSNAIHDCDKLRGRIAYDKIPSGNENLHVIMQAMQRGLMISVIYQSFHDKEPREYVLSPYFIKVFKQRWYMVARRKDTTDLRIYCFDRMKQVDLTAEPFTFPEDMSVDAFFYDCYGIEYEPEDYDVEKIRIKVTDKNNKRQYLRTLPLHHSQREIEKHEDYSIFELTVYPTYDFIHELLSHAEELEVVEPQWVRDECKWHIKAMYDIYK